MFCYNCKAEIELPTKKVSFRAICEKCGADLHVCKNCKYYTLGKPNDCFVPNTEYVADKEKYNFCEEFFPLEELPSSSKSQSKEDVLKRLFKD